MIGSEEDEETPTMEENYQPTTPSHDIDGEVQREQEQAQGNSAPLQANTAPVPTSTAEENLTEQDEFDVIIPEAYIPDESREVIDVVAEPLLPWWKQRRTRVLFGVISLVFALEWRSLETGLRLKYCRLLSLRLLLSVLCHHQNPVLLHQPYTQRIFLLQARYLLLHPQIVLIRLLKVHNN